MFFNHLGNKYPHHIRIPIYSLAFCFAWAFVAQAFFQIADITGGYIAGLDPLGDLPERLHRSPGRNDLERFLRADLSSPRWP
jgi:hypothetical protein